MDARDRFILDYCTGDFRPLRPLTKQMPSGSLYRHARRLVAIGWLRKEGGLYQTSEVGLRQLTGVQGGRQWGVLEKLYPPLGLVPTAVHRALVGLILAAVVARRHETRPDRHPCFIAFGSTLHWKTSAGLFVCHALGLDPTGHVVDCGAETGKSLTVRRAGTGEAIFKRALLEAPFVVLDEFLTADTAVRNTLSIFLGGRLVVPFENEQLRVCPVPLLTMNPRPKSTLEGRIGLSAAQIRRAILVDLDTVSMPDLAVVGDRALEAARSHPPLELGAPAMNCRIHHDRIVEVTRAVLTPEAHGRVDVEIVANLATGMTAFIADATEAIAQVAHDLCLLAETLGWTRPGWIQTVTDFSVNSGKKLASRAPATPTATTTLAKIEPAVTGASDRTPPHAISMAVHEPVRRKGHVPDIALSEATLMRLIWFAHETGQDTDGAIHLLLDFYLEWRDREKTIETIEQCLTLARELGLAAIEVDTLHDYLADRQSLAEYNCSFADLPEALRVLDLLSQLPTEWDWERASAAMQAVANLLREGIALAEIGAFIARHRRLKTLGFDEPTAEVLAGVLTEAGAVGDQRDAVTRRLVDQATAQVNLDDIAANSETLQGEVAELEARQAQLERDLGALQGRWEALCRDVRAAQATLAEIRAEHAMKAGDLDVLAALRHLLRRNTAAAEAFFEDLRKLDRWRKAGGTLDDWVGATYVKGLAEKLAAFFQQLLQEAQGKS